MKRALFVVNLHSGRGEVKNNLGAVLGVLEKYGYEVVVHATRSRGDAARLVKKRAKDFDLVVCSGGDGTLNETVTGVLQSGLRVPVGYIPAGSTNDFASSLNIPKGPKNAALAIAKGKPFSCDVGELNQKTFLYSAAFGILSDIPYRTRQGLKNVIGHGAYVLEFTKEALTAPFGFYPSIPLKISVNGEELEDTYCYGMITNTSSVGGVKGVTGDRVELDDGLLEVTLIKRPPLAIWFPWIFANLLHLVKHSRHVYTCKASELKIRAEKPLAWTLDGEFGGEWEEMEIRCVRRAVDFMVR